jgi:UDP-N-acetylmuramoyl-L-alanyl-D-glutamate--2,6-diaminopimelate ligase
VTAAWRAVDAAPADAGSDFVVITPDGARIPAHVGLPGSFNVANSLGAIACADILGVATPTAVAGVAACEGVPGRMQSVRNELGIRAYVDYAHTPDAVERAISATPGRVVVVLGCGGDRDAGKRPLMGAAAARLAQKVIVTDDNPRSEDPAVIRAAVMGGALEVPEGERAEMVEVADRRAAIRAAVASTRAGDAVLVLGKGHEQGQTIGATTHPFDDVAELAAALEVDAK